jgi:prophage regulatory protein
MNQRIIRLPEVKQKTGQSRSTIYERIRQGMFPAPIQLGGRSVGWLESEIDEWIIACIEKTRTAKAGQKP